MCSSWNQVTLLKKHRIGGTTHLIYSSRLAMQGVVRRVTLKNNQFIEKSKCKHFLSSTQMGMLCVGLRWYCVNFLPPLPSVLFDAWQLQSVPCGSSVSTELRWPFTQWWVVGHTGRTGFPLPSPGDGSCKAWVIPGQINCIYIALLTLADISKCCTETQPKTPNSK